MEDYAKSKKEMNFQNIESLKCVENVLNEAGEAIKDRSRHIQDSPISETLSGAAGVGVGAGIGFAGLYFGGTAGLSAAGITSGLAAAGGLIGGGMTAGIAVLAAPAVLLGGAGIYAASKAKAKKLKNTKEIMYKDAIAKQTAIIKALQEEMNLDKERIEYLNSLNVLLQAAIKDLKFDLGKDALVPFHE